MKCFMRSVLCKAEENQKQCVIMQDKIYVKKWCYIMGNLCLIGRLLILFPNDQLLPSGLLTVFPVKSFFQIFVKKHKKITAKERSFDKFTSNCLTYIKFANVAFFGIMNL